MNYTDIEMFQARMQSDSRYFDTSVFTGVHTGGHNTISGDPGGVRYAQLPFLSPSGKITDIGDVS